MILSINTIYILLIAAAALFVLFIAFSIAKILKKRAKQKPNKKIENIKLKKQKAEQKILSKSYSLSLREQYLSSKELDFYTFLCGVLPKEFIAIPKVAISDILRPVGRRDVYDKLSKSNLDFCVFKKENMAPVVVIDLFDDSFVDQELFCDNPLVVACLASVKLDVVKIKVQKTYSADNINELLKKYLL